MTTITNQTTRATKTAPVEPFSLMGIISFIFALELREKLDADTGGDKSDAAYHYGL
ncbi:hypothetical protein ACLB1G_00670 [Oxalobacteraceae bacterium A2-2]